MFIISDSLPWSQKMTNTRQLQRKYILSDKTVFHVATITPYLLQLLNSGSSHSIPDFHEQNLQSEPGKHHDK